MHRSLRLAAAALLLLARRAPAQSDSVDAYVKRAMASFHIPGLVVAVARDGRPPVIRAYGLANVEVGAAASPASVFKVGSVTKQFTAAAILLLAQDGKLALDTDAATYLPDIPNVPRGVTVRHLLTHTSGIADYTELPNSISFARLDRLPREVVKPALETPLLFTPGAQYAYSNTNYVLLAMIVERVAGNRRFGAVLQERLFGPLGMTATRTDDRQAVVPNRAAGYNWVNGTFVNAQYVSPSNTFGSGNVISTAEDLVRWMAALHGGRVMAPAMLAQMLAPATLAGGQRIRYGLGTEIGEQSGHPVVGHGGETAGFNAQVSRYPNDHLTLVVLANQGDAPSDEIARHVAASVLGLPDLSTAALKPIPDPDPQLTRRLERLLVASAAGHPDPAEFAEEARRDLVPTITRVGPEFLGRRGPMKSLVLVDRREERGRRWLVYRQAFAEGPTILWTFQLSTTGAIASMEPRLEP